MVATEGSGDVARDVIEVRGDVDSPGPVAGPAGGARLGSNDPGHHVAGRAISTSWASPDSTAATSRDRLDFASCMFTRTGAA